MLQLTHLRFDCVARGPIVLGREKAGHRLRGALGQVMLRAYCPEQQRNPKPLPEHAAICPACWLLAHETTPGEARRVYSLVPPLPLPTVIPAGNRFSFTLTLFGEAGLNFLAYLVLAAAEMGREGVGPQRGRFDLLEVWSVNPLTDDPTRRQRCLLPQGSRTLYPDWVPVSARQAAQAAATWQGRTLCLEFLTPTRLIHDGRLVRTPDFGVFFRRLLHRLDHLDQQFNGAPRRPQAEVERLHALADAVRLVDSRVTWRDFKTWSGRQQRATPMSGFVGRAYYHADDWTPLLPVLLLGQAIQVGKAVVKGNGVFHIHWPEQRAYWDTVYAAPW